MYSANSTALNNLAGKLIGKRPLGRPRLKWAGNIRMNNKEIHTKTRNWVDLAHDRDC